MAQHLHGAVARVCHIDQVLVCDHGGVAGQIANTLHPVEDEVRVAPQPLFPDRASFGAEALVQQAYQFGGVTPPCLGVAEASVGDQMLQIQRRAEVGPVAAGV